MTEYGSLVIKGQEYQVLSITRDETDGVYTLFLKKPKGKKNHVSFWHGIGYGFTEPVCVGGVA